MVRYIFKVNWQRWIMMISLMDDFLLSWMWFNIFYWDMRRIFYQELVRNWPSGFLESMICTIYILILQFFRDEPDKEDNCFFLRPTSSSSFRGKHDRSLLRHLNLTLNILHMVMLMNFWCFCRVSTQRLKVISWQLTAPPHPKLLLSVLFVWPCSCGRSR